MDHDASHSTKLRHDRKFWPWPFENHLSGDSSSFVFPPHQPRAGLRSQVAGSRESPIALSLAGRRSGRSPTLRPGRRWSPAGWRGHNPPGSCRIHPGRAHDRRPGRMWWPGAVGRGSPPAPARGRRPSSTPGDGPSSLESPGRGWRRGPAPGSRRGWWPPGRLARGRSPGRARPGPGQPRDSGARRPGPETARRSAIESTTPAESPGCSGPGRRSGVAPGTSRSRRTPWCPAAGP